MSIDDATPEMWDRLRQKYAAVIMEDEVTEEEKKEGVGTFPKELYKAPKESVENVAGVFPEDNVNNPQHYNSGNIECIEAIAESMSNEQFRGYLKGNCMKYLWRYDYKGKAAEDLQKAGWYLNKLIKEVS